MIKIALCDDNEVEKKITSQNSNGSFTGTTSGSVDRGVFLR